MFIVIDVIVSSKAAQVLQIGLRRITKHLVYIDHSTKYTVFQMMVNLVLVEQLFWLSSLPRLLVFL